MKAIGYVRVSTGQQVESGLGQEAQRASLAVCAKKLGLELVLHEDPAVKGDLALADRPGLLAAVSSLEEGDVLLVARRDRLGRDVVNVALVEQAVAARGARVVSAAGEASDLAGPLGVLIRTIMDAVNVYEKAQVGVRTRAALAAKKARGERLGHAPYGYRFVEGQLVPRDDEQEGVALIRKRHRKGDSLRTICDALRGAGIAPRGKGGRWHPTAVRLVLRARVWLSVRSSNEE